MSRNNSPGSVDSFVEQVCSHVKAKDVHPDIQLEMKSHLEDLMEDKLSEGLSQEEATHQALAQMGNPDQIGKQLHTAHKPVMEWSLAVIVAVMVGIGLVVMYALQIAYSGQASGQPSDFYGHLLFNKAFFSGIGVLLLVAIYFLDYRKIRKYSWHLYFVTITLMLVCSVVGTEINGAKRWIAVGGFAFDIYALSTYLFLIAASGMLLGRKKMKRGTFRNVGELIKMTLIYVVVPALLYMKGNSFFDFIGYGLGLFILLIFIAKAYKLIFAGMASLLVIVIGSMLTMEFRVQNALERYVSFFMWTDPEGLGYQRQNAIDAVLNAGMWGHGFGVLNEKIRYLHSDMVFSYIIYSFGWVFGSILLLFTILFLFKSYSAIRGLKDSYAKAIGFSLLSIIGFRFIWNILMTLGIVPIASLNMPFVSYGGSGGILELMAMGMILSVCRRRNMVSQLDREVWM
ncbi:FtsW/RodA/SpoVE family cell cycle protein [Paenibacillus luteus]|uniref:FtsW/RodA/SpoVE family cell cycle protein n=1 Tax=Paenibacillus luteus TaxID=2545753 RepID=UPI00114454D1|nr:FtsW/RodA/SpoVE family cell cycle protein [Paenibacillus luteus]